MNIQSLNLIVDLNNDGRYSVWELWEAIKFVYRLPGNLLVEGMGHVPPVASLFRIEATPVNGYDSLDGLLSVTLSLIFWVIVVFGILTLLSPSVDSGDETLDVDPDNAHNSYRSYSAGSTAMAGNARVANDAVQATAKRHHHPVSRPTYAAPGRKPKRHPWHHLTATLFRHVKP